MSDERLDGISKLCLERLDLPEQLELGNRTHLVVLGIQNLVIDIAIEIVGQEAHALHVREQCHGVRQILNLDWSEEAPCRLKIALGEGLEDLRSEMDLGDVWLVFGRCVGCRAEEVAIVGEDVGWHDGIEVDDAEE